MSIAEAEIERGGGSGVAAGSAKSRRNLGMP
jgi:hypothetical protein